MRVGIGLIIAGVVMLNGVGTATAQQDAEPTPE
jgi:hypothetical protein